MWRRRRWRGAGRWAGRGAVLALALLGLGLGGSGGGEELLAAALAAWEERGEPAGGANDAGFVRAANLANGAGFANTAFADGANGADAAGFANTAFADDAIVAKGAGLANGASFANGADFAYAAALADAAILADAAAFADTTDPSAPPRLLPPPLPCGAPPPFLLVLVPSAPSHAAQRQAVRDTWGGDPRPGGLSARTLFVLGVPGGPAEQAALAAERRRHGDLLQGPFGDTYANLTLKTLLLLRWAAVRCPGSRFVLKADDDVFVNLPALTRHLQSRPRPRRLYLGRVHWWVRPERDPRARHHVPVTAYPGAAFPPYCSGTAYVLSREAVLAVLAAAPHVPLVSPEDVWVGLCARQAGVSPRHSARMAGATRFPPDRCCLGELLFSAHRLRPLELRGVWALLRGDGEGCGAVQRALGLLRCRAMAAAQQLWG